MEKFNNLSKGPTFDLIKTGGAAAILYCLYTSVLPPLVEIVTLLREIKTQQQDNAIAIATDHREMSESIREIRYAILGGELDNKKKH